MKKISVVIPILNESKVIKECLKNLLSQSYKPIEVIVVDNGSSDNSANLVKSMGKEFVKRGIKLILLSCHYGNQINARNLGVRKSRGEIVGFIDADTFLDMNWVLNLEKYFHDPKIVGVGGKCYFRNKGKMLNFFYVVGYYYTTILIGWYRLGGGNSAFRRSAFIKVKGYSGLEELIRDKKLVYPEDDLFISKKLERLGELKFCSDVNATILQRTRSDKTKKAIKDSSFLHLLVRLYDITADSYKIIRYLKLSFN